MKPGAVRVVAHRPGRRALVLLGAGALVIGVALGAYHLGRSQTERRLAAAAAVEQAYEEANARILELERRVADDSLARSVDGEAQAQLRGTIKSLGDELAEAQEELRFYRQLMAPSEAERGLRVERFELRPDAARGAISYRLLLTQVVDRHDWLSGTVRIDVAGTRGEAEQVLSLTELSSADAYPLPFRFRYFEDLRGSLTLPDGFVPARVTIVAEASGKRARRVERTFEWTLEEG
jgi:hypothetical protein